MVTLKKEIYIEWTCIPFDRICPGISYDSNDAKREVSNVVQLVLPYLLPGFFASVVFR